MEKKVFKVQCKETGKVYEVFEVIQSLGNYSLGDYFDSYGGEVSARSVGFLIHSGTDFVVKRADHFEPIQSPLKNALRGVPNEN